VESQRSHTRCSQFGSNGWRIPSRGQSGRGGSLGHHSGCVWRYPLSRRVEHALLSLSLHMSEQLCPKHDIPLSLPRFWIGRTGVGTLCPNYANAWQNQGQFENILKAKFPQRLGSAALSFLHVLEVFVSLRDSVPMQQCINLGSLIARNGTSCEKSIR
jgi:hypothetical protein